MSLLESQELHIISINNNKNQFNSIQETENNQEVIENVFEESKQREDISVKFTVQDLNSYAEITSESFNNYSLAEKKNKFIKKIDYNKIRKDLESGTQFSKKKRRILSSENIRGIKIFDYQQENKKDFRSDLYLKKCISLNNVLITNNLIYPLNHKFSTNPENYQVVLSQESNSNSIKKRSTNSVTFKYKRNNLRIYIPNNLQFGSDYQNNSRVVYSEFSTSSKRSIFSSFSQFSQKFTKNYFSNSDIYEVNNQLLTKDIRIKRIFERINLKKNIFNFHPDEIIALNLNPDIDFFIIKILNLFEKTETSKKDLIDRLNQDFPNRYESFFMKILFMMMEVKLIPGDKETIKEVILRELKYSNNLIKRNEYLLPDSKEELNDNDLFIFSANTLLILLGIELEDFEVYCFRDINLYFTIKLYIYTEDYQSGLAELKILFEKENYFNNKSIFLHYFSKIIYRISMTNIELIRSMNDYSDLTYSKTTNIMKTAISLISNGKRKGKIYLYLSQLSLIYHDYEMFNFYILQSNYFLNLE